MGNQVQLTFGSSRRAIYIRFTENEWKALQTICAERSQKAQDIIKYATFNGDQKPFMAKDTALKVITELKRIGNNFNQIAKHLNSGSRHGWSNSFESCADDISKLRQLVTKDVPA